MSAPIDYTTHYTAIRDELSQSRDMLAEKLDQLTQTLTTISQHLESTAESLQQICTVQEALHERASRDTLGIVMRGTRHDGELSRAAMISALQSSNRLDAVRDEMTAPTPMP